MLSCAARASSLGSSANGAAGRRRLERLLQPEVVDHQHGVGIAGRQQSGLLQTPPAQQIDRQGVSRGCRQNPVESRVGRVGRHPFPHHDPDRDRALGGSPVGDRVGHTRVRWIDRLDQPEPAGMRRVNLKRVAGVVAIHRERRDQQRAVDTDSVHGGHHVVARDLGRTMQKASPGTPRMVAFIGVNLSIYRDHGFPLIRPTLFTNLDNRPIRAFPWHDVEAIERLEAKLSVAVRQCQAPDQ